MTPPRLVIAFACLALLGSGAVADVINVPGEYPTIQGAIDASSNGDVIQIAGGTFNEHSLNPSGKAITIQGTLNGDGTLATTIDAQQGGSVFVINSGEGNGTVIKDLVITGGSSNSGGGLYCFSSSPTITGCTISGNTANADSSQWGGGGIYCENNTSPTITNCIVSNNTSGRDAGGISCVGSNATITDCTITGNTADHHGGGICINGPYATITDCTISGNTAKYGGGIASYFGNPSIVDCMISGNTALSFGGGIALPGGGSPIIDGCTISNNHGPNYGGGIHGSFTTSTITDCRIMDNTTGSNGGGIYLWSSESTITNCTIMGNTAKKGGGINCEFQSNPSITDCKIMGNTAQHHGGGIYCEFETNPTITGCRISVNHAGIWGGGIFQDPNPHYPSISLLTDTTVCGNDPDQIIGDWTDDGGNTVEDECPACPGDATGDGYVDVNDVLYLISAWDTPDPNADFDGDGLVDADDVLILLSHYGESCP